MKFLIARKVVPGTTFLIVGLLTGRLPAMEPDIPAVPLMANDRILILAPHPDDDILACAGVIQSALEKNMPVAVVYLTNGDNYEWAFMAYKKRPMLLPSEMRAMGRLRHQEAVAAENLLGVPEDRLFFLGYPDWGTEHIFMEHWGKDRPAFRSMLTKVRAVPYDDAFRPGAPYKGESVLTDLESIMGDFRPTKVFVSHPADAHRDHRTFFLFAQVALWDLEDRIRPIVYPYLIHYPHWPSPKGFQTGRILAPPPYFKDLQWTEQRLSDPPIERKRQALELHRTQMVLNRRYLESFVAKNEIFSGFPDILPGGRIKEPIALPHQAVEEAAGGVAVSSMTEVHWREIYVEGGELVVQMEMSSHSHVNHPVTMYAFGYRHDRAFAAMPKLKLLIRGQRLTLFDQGWRIRDTDIDVRRTGRMLAVRLPLEALGDPERVIGTAWSSSAEEPFDWRVWRVVDLRGK